MRSSPPVDFLCVATDGSWSAMTALGEGWPFVGRQKELALIAKAMGDPGTGGLVVTGPAGVGKTRLALRSLSTADPARYVTRRTSATGASRSIPFGAMAQLLPAEMPALGRRRANPLRQASDALLAVAGERRLALAVDDAQSLDDFS